MEVLDIRNKDKDMLSSLPDDLIHKILSRLPIKEAIHTSILSSRWRYIWTSMTCLSFDQGIDPSMCSEFVRHVLSHRNHLVGLSSVNVRRVQGNYTFFETVLNYAFCHNVQKLRYKCCVRMKLPVSVFSSKSLKHLTLRGSRLREITMPPSIWELPALTTLHLRCVVFVDDGTTDKCIGLFSKCLNLKNLTLRWCIMMGSEDFHICHPLSSLAVMSYGRHLFRGLQLSTHTLHSLKKLYLHVEKPEEANPSQLFGLLQQLNGVEYLILNLELVKFLSSSMEKSISRPPSPFASLKFFKIYLSDDSKYDGKQESLLSTEIKSYILDGSPRASFTLIRVSGTRYTISWA